MSKFPEKIWDGLSPTRKDMVSECPPDYRDWVTIVDEIRAIQQYLLALTGNIKLMPDLSSCLDACEKKIAAVDSEINSRSLPVDLLQEFQVHAKLLSEVNSRSKVNELKVDLQQIRSDKLESDLQNRNENLAQRQEDAYFKNDIRREIDTFKRNVEFVLGEIKAQVRRIESLVSLQQAVEKLQNL